MNTGEPVRVKNSGTAEFIFDELKRDLAEWMTTDRDMVWRPPLTFMRDENEYAIRGFMPGVDAKNVEVMIAPDIMLIKGEINPEKPGRRTLLRSVKFPRPIDPKKVHAEMTDGMLSVTAEIAGTAFNNVVKFVPRAA